MLTAIIFDLDGVLIESTEMKTRAFRVLFADHPAHLAQIIAYHEANGGLPRFDKFRHIYAEILKEPLPEEQFKALCARYSELCLLEVLVAPLVAGAQDFLRDCAHHLRLFVASGTPQGELEVILDRRGLTGYFQGVFGSPASKAEIVERILAGWSLKPTETAFVGDSEADRTAAHRHGVQFIGRIHTGSPADWETRPGLVKVEDLTELKGLVEGHASPVSRTREAAR